MRRIAVLTSGGDSPGMNAAIRAVVRSGLNSPLEVVGIQKGYQRLIDRHAEQLTTRSVSGKPRERGPFLESARGLKMLGLSCGAVVQNDREEISRKGRRDIDAALLRLAAMLGI